jgi:hypothetical protein
LIFGGDNPWTTVGFVNLRHLSERIKKHEGSALHLENTFQFKMFGTVNIASQIDNAHKITIQKHNELVTKYKHILNKVIECIKFCGTHELALTGHTETQGSANRGNFLDLLYLLSNLDSVLDEHLNSTSTFKYTSHTIQNELLDCMYQVYIEKLTKDVNAANYVSLQADETTDITCKSQFVINYAILRGINQ